MADLSSYNDYLSRIANGFSRTVPFVTRIDATTSSTIYSGQLGSLQFLGAVYTVPTLESGVTNYKLSSCAIGSSSATGKIIVGKGILLGSLNIAGPTFTDGSAWSTITEGGSSRQTCGAVLAVTNTTLGGTAGSMTITYVDQDGNTAETISSLTLTSSSVAGTAGFIPLNSGDTGARDITTATRTGGSSPTGIIDFYGFQGLATLELLGAQQFSIVNFLSQLPCPPKFAAGELVVLLRYATTATNAISGQLEFVGGQS